jgi:hypothetical protein
MNYGVYYDLDLWDDVVQGSAFRSMFEKIVSNSNFVADDWVEAGK